VGGASYWPAYGPRLSHKQPVTDPHTQIAAGLEQFVILPRVTLVERMGAGPVATQC